MANGYMPYNVAGQQQGLLESLMGAKQAQTQSQFGIGQQKGEMMEEFQKEAIAAQKKQEQLLQQKRKGKGLGGFLEKLVPMLGMIPGVGSIASATLGGLQGMYTMGKESKFAKEQIEKARGAGLSDEWGGTFLGGQAREMTGKTETMLDKMTREADVSGMDLLTKGLTSGITGFAMGKLGEGIGESFKGLKSGDVVTGEAAKGLKAVKKSGLDFDKLGGGEAVNIDAASGGIKNIDVSKLSTDEIDKISGLAKKLNITDYDPNVVLQKTINQMYNLGSKQTLLGSLFGAGGLGQDPSTLLEEGKPGANVLQNLLLPLLMSQGDR